MHLAQPLVHGFVGGGSVTITLEQVKRAFPYGEEKEQGKAWLTRCLIHNDKNHPNLKISIENGKLLTYCNAGVCADKKAEVFRAVLAKLKQVAPSNQEEQPSKDEEPKKWNYTLARLESAEASLEKAAAFLSTRGITLETARRFRFGFENGRIVMPTFVEGELAVVKSRAIDPANPHKWEKSNRDEKVFHLFKQDTAQFAPELYVVESELDCTMLNSMGLHAVSVETSGHKLNPEDLKLLKGISGRVILALDSDPSGQKCADRFEAELAAVKPLRIIPQGFKDFGELYANDPEKFSERLEALKQEALSRPPAWRKFYKTVDELLEGEERVLVRGILNEGRTFFTGPPGVGKTWVLLSLAKALTTGRPFVGVHEVLEPMNVLYLCPEMGSRALRKRCTRLGISKKFFIHSMNEEFTPLTSPLLAQAIADLSPCVVVLDTLIRFSNAEDENSSTETSGVAAAMAELVNAGAVAVIAIHHSTKAAANQSFVEIGSSVRGSSELGAGPDAIWVVRHVDNTDETRKQVKLRLECAKARNLDPPADPFVIQGRPFIDEKGDFAVLADDQTTAYARLEEKQQVKATRDAEWARLHAEGMGYKAIAEKYAVGKSTVRDAIKAAALQPEAKNVL
jgi:hypothetical protein